MSETLDNVTVMPVVQSHYDKIFQDGFLVSVHISIWGMGAQLSEDDIELKEDTTLPRIFRLGKKMLIDPKHLNEFKRLESKARRYLYGNSYYFPISDAHFVPKRKLGDVILKLNEFRTEFFKKVEEFKTNYEGYKAAIIAEFPDNKEMLEPYYPPQDKIGSKFGFSMSAYELAMPKELGNVDLQSLISRDEAKKEVKEQLQAQLKEQHESSIRQIEQFTEEAVKALRIRIVETCESVTEKIKKGELVSKTNISSIKDLIEDFRGLNFLDDKTVAAEIDKLSAFVNGNHNFKSDQEAIANLNTALAQVLEKAGTMTDIPALRGRYFRAIKT